MTFLQPWAVWFFAGAPIIVLLYFLRHKRRTLSVSTHLFWQRALQETSRRALFRRLRNIFSLLLHLLIFALIVGALSRPSLQRELPSGASTVIVLDARARMQATEPDGQTRFAKALEIARAQARGASEQQQTALILLEANAAVAVPFSADEKPLLDALKSAAPVDCTGDIDAALRLADALLASRQGTRNVVLISDRLPANRDPKSASITTRLVGSPRDNVAITRLATRPLPASPETSEVLLEVQNFGATAVTTDVELAFDGRPLEVRPYTLAPGQRRQEILASVPHPGRNARGWLTAHLTAADALAVDNTAYALLPPARPARVLLVSNGSPFLEKLLAVDVTVKYQVITPDAWQPTLAPKFETIIFDGSLPAGFDLKSAEGNYLFLKSTPFPTGAKLEAPMVTELDAAHPATRNVSLQNVSILHAAGLALPEPRDGWTFRAPMRSFDHPLLIVGERKSQRMAALAFDVLESDLPLRVAFPLLINNTIRWLSGEQTDSTASVPAGETITLGPGERMAAEPFTTPPPRFPETNLTRAFQPVRNGYYALTSGEANRWVAVNTFSAAESDLRAATGRQDDVAAVSSVTSLAGLPPWQWLSVAALFLFTAEWWMFHRRKTE